MFAHGHAEVHMTLSTEVAYCAWNQSLPLIPLQIWVSIIVPTLKARTARPATKKMRPTTKVRIPSGMAQK